MNCIFCQGAEESASSKEHLLSVPVCRGFGIDRSAFTARVDGRGDAIKSLAHLHETQVRLPCRSCNSGWMSELECQMEEVVAPWARGRDQLGAKGFLSLTRWALKTHIVLSALDGGIRAFGSAAQDDKMGVLPEATRARQLFQNDPHALDGVKIGIARVERSQYLWGFGNPTVVPKGPRYANSRSASVTCLNLGPMQLWIVVPVFRSATVRLPPKVTPAAANLVFAELLYASVGEPALEDAVVDNGEHDIEAIFAEATAALSRQQAVEGA